MHENLLEHTKNSESITIDSLSISLTLSQALLHSGFETLGNIVSKEESFFTINNIPGFTPFVKKELDMILQENSLEYKK